MIVHAGLVALRHREYWRGLLILGASGAGKSDLALRLVEAGCILVADDRTLIWASAGRLYGRAAPTLAGKIEARGLGVLESGFLDLSAIAAAVELDPKAAIERMPAEAVKTLLGLGIPLVRLAPFEASAPAKLRRWLIALG